MAEESGPDNCKREKSARLPDRVGVNARRPLQRQENRAEKCKRVLSFRRQPKWLVAARGRAVVVN